MVEKKITQGRICITWADAQSHMKAFGWADLKTSGGDTWNKGLADKLTKYLGTKVLCRGESPGYNMKGIYRYSIEVKTNREAKGLLSEEY